MGKKAKKNSLFADLENELDNPELVKKLEEADIAPVLSKSQQKKLKREQRKKGANIQLDSAGEEEEEIPIPNKKGAKNKGKASFADLVSDEEEESEEETPAPKKGNKGGNGKKGKGKASFADLMSDEEEEEEEPVPAKGGKGKKNKGKNKGKPSFADLASEEEKSEKQEEKVTKKKKSAFEMLPTKCQKEMIS